MFLYVFLNENITVIHIFIVQLLHVFGMASRRMLLLYSN